MAATPSSRRSESPIPISVHEFDICVPKYQEKRHNVMRFNANLKVDFTEWKSVKMQRENNMKEFRDMEEEQPKFGAGSEFNREMREEIRRKKFGIVSKKYRPEDQPWILKVAGKPDKKFKGFREGGVSDNTAFYVFTQAPTGGIEAYPLNEWYNFQPIQRYKALSAEEAEQEFGRRKKVLNFFSLMLRKRLKSDEDDEKDPDEAKVNLSKAKELKISEMDEWIESDDESSSNSDEDEKNKNKHDSDDDARNKKQKKKNLANNKVKKRDVNCEAFEESDDGDEDGREMDYDTESSEDVPDAEGQINKDMKSVAEEDALRNLLQSDEDDEDENKSDASECTDDNKKNEQKDEKSTDKRGKSKTGAKKGNSSSDLTSENSDSDGECVKVKKASNNKNNYTKVNNSSSRSTTPITTNESNNTKRKLDSMPSDLTGSENSNSPPSTNAKRIKNDCAPSLPLSFAGVINASSKDDTGITEEAVRRYLMRKPMTTTELLSKFKSKRTSLTSERLVETLTQILKKINPVRQTIQGRMYLSIKVNRADNYE